MRRASPTPLADPMAVVGAAFEALPLAAAILDPGGRLARTNALWEQLDPAVLAAFGGSVLAPGGGAHEPLRAALRNLLVGAGEPVRTCLVAGAPPRRYRVSAALAVDAQRRHAVVTIDPAPADAGLLGSILDSLPAAILVTDADDRVTVVNDRFKAFFPEAGHHVEQGLSFEQGLRRSIAAGQLPEAAADPEAFVAERMAQHRQADGVPRLRHTAGGISFLVQERRLPNGGSLLISTDVSDLSDQRDALARSEAMLRGILDNVGDMVVTVDAAGAIVAFNRAAERLLGWREAEIRGSSAAVLGLIVADRPAGGQLRLFRRPAGSGPAREVAVRRRDGGEIACEMVVGEMQAGQQDLFIVSLHDISDRVRLLETIRQSRQQLLTMADQMPGLIVYFDTGLRLRFINRTGEIWHARRREDALGRHISDLLAPPRMAEIQDAVDDVLAGRPVHVERQIDYADGQRRIVEVNYVPDRSEVGAVRGFFVFAFDVSERRRVEEQLRQAQKLEALGKLTGGIAHDFNNLLGVIVGCLDLLGDRLPARSKTRALVDKAVGAAQRGASLTERLLTFSRKQVLRTTAVDVNALLRDMLILMPRSLGPDIRIVTRLADDLWPCEVDRGLLESAILNLAINARDAMPEGGSITVTTANVTVRAADPDRLLTLRGGDYVRIAIVDTGTGMTPDVAERAFEPFFTTKAEGRGTGLGLSMVYGFARQSGGGVAIDSGPGRGTAVTLYLPRATDRRAAASGASRAGRHMAGRHRTGQGEFVLVVEDDVAVREMATDSLLRLGYMPIAVPGAMEALAALAEPRDWAVLFTDMVLRHGGDGLRLAREAERQRPGIRVLLTTGYAESDLMAAAEAAGRPVLRKPYRIDQLDEAMAALMEDAAARS